MKKNEKDLSIKTNNKIQTPNKIFNTEGNKTFERFKPYYPNKIFFYNSINKKKSKIKSFSNNKIALSVDKRNGLLPLINNGQQFFSKKKNEWFNTGFQNNKNGNVYEHLTINSNNVNERDNLLEELYHTQNDMNKANKEIRDLKAMFDIMEKENLSNKYMISQLLNKKKGTKIEISTSNRSLNTENESGNNNTIEKNNNNNNTEVNINNTKDNNDIKSKKNICKTEINIKGNNKDNNKDNNRLKKVKTMVNNNSNKIIKKDKRNTIDIDKSKINVLKKELTYYKKCLDTKEEELAKFKETNEMKQYNQTP